MKILRHRPAGSSPSGPYSPAVEVVSGDLGTLYVSGQGTMNPRTGERVLGDATSQARAALENLRLVVEGSGYSMSQVVKVTLYLRSMADFSAVNAVYKEYFPEGAYPARATVAVADLPGGQAVEIDAIAVREIAE